METLKTVKTINTLNSTNLWTGKKIGGSHTGTISLKSGELVFENEQLVNGAFTIDMSSITVTDLTGEMKGKLEGHLKSDDFFSTASYPDAKLDFTKVISHGNTYQVTANLTVKNITDTIDFELTVTENEASTTLVIDRSKYDVKFGSKSFFKSLGDNLIHDHFEVAVALQF